VHGNIENSEYLSQQHHIENSEYLSQQHQSVCFWISN
jgi:hypothetical protein